MENKYCQDCIHYPCPDLDDDTEIFDCDYKATHLTSWDIGEIDGRL